ncbi:hypothetical protein HELRODRAFT_131399, partial [Helobdella robusta]|uniref:SP-RING-type domain-containing protein n=1 Tax=Helobdella robusta TaxID=6412 RepID=T1EHV8_HELRO
EKLKKLVKDLRHNDLKLILNFAKRNSSGRKQELLERLNDVIDCGCPVSLAVKINEMSKKRNALNANSKLSSVASARDRGGTTISHTFTHATELEKSKKTNEADKDNNNSVNSSSSNENSSSSSGSLDIPFYPDVRFRHLPFYDFCDDLLKPIGMKDKNLGSKNNPKFAKYEFFLTPQQAKKIKDSQIMIDECMIEYGVQVLLRYCLLETTAEQDDNLPPKLCVHVNTKLITLPNFITPSHMGIEPKRPNRPLDITHACELNPLKPNFVSMTWVSDPVHNHCFGITLCKKLNCTTLLNRLKQNCSRHPDLTRALIKEKLAVNIDNEISFTCLKISLICPLGKTRLVLPCRSSNCSHLQCFDASTYLQMNDKKPTWVCPICDKLARYDSLIIDGLFIEILQKVKDTNEIQFLEDGNWKPIVKKQQ